MSGSWTPGHVHHVCDACGKVTEFSYSPPTIAMMPTWTCDCGHRVVLADMRAFLVSSDGGLRYRVHLGAGEDIVSALSLRHPTLPRRDLIAATPTKVVAITGLAGGPPAPPPRPLIGSLEAIAEAHVPSVADGGPVTYTDRRRWDPDTERPVAAMWLPTQAR